MKMIRMFLLVVMIALGSTMIDGCWVVHPPAPPAPPGLPPPPPPPPILVP